MIFQSNDPLRTITRRATLRFRWALAEGEIPTPHKMWDRVREIVYNEVSALSNADMLEFARRYAQFRTPPPVGATKEEHIRSELQEYLRQELGYMLQNMLDGGVDVYIRVRRHEIEITGFGTRPSTPRPEPRNESSWNQHAHY